MLQLQYHLKPATQALFCTSPAEECMTPPPERARPRAQQCAVTQRSRPGRTRWNAVRCCARGRARSDNGGGVQMRPRTRTRTILGKKKTVEASGETSTVFARGPQA